MQLDQFHRFNLQWTIRMIVGRSECRGKSACAGGRKRRRSRAEQEMATVRLRKNCRGARAKGVKRASHRFLVILPLAEHEDNQPSGRSATYPLYRATNLGETNCVKAHIFLESQATKDVLNC
jgi:hypothetical protein